ncbi:hypothetical protein IFM89_004031 [Coptis chinensis]|uniref:P-type ATPase A domain-containing protein n=1 Tax=Coptis chinensis TaxID=261450 RepID=A0A835L9Z0_9MAGN|nr:hypothetical protein IFM89_004031 [Coptis chinensis]
MQSYGTDKVGWLFAPIAFLWFLMMGGVAAIEKDLWATGSVNEEYLKALNSLFSNFPRLRATEPATLSIPHLVTSLKTGSEATQEAALDSLFHLRQAWSACPAEVSKTQSVAAAEAIPLLQYLIQSSPPRFQEKAELLLQCLPGTLVVTIKRGNNLKQSVGNASVDCKITLGNTPPRQTQVLRDGKWNEEDAAVLVPGDVISIKLGDIVPSDARLLEGDPLKIEQSSLTGESLPVTKGPGDGVYSGSTLHPNDLNHPKTQCIQF